MPQPKVNPARLEMLWGRLRSAANEQAATLVRTAFSSVVRDMNDYACSIFDARGRLVAQPDTNTPGLSCSMGRMLAYMLRLCPPETLEPGDVLASNDPWEATGHHNDITVYTPVYHENAIVAYTANAAHHVDIGGRRADMMSRDNYEEGLRIPVCKLYRRGEPNDDVFAFIRANVRSAETVVGDIRAQVAANHVAGRRLAAIVAELGSDGFERVADAIISRSRALMLATISGLPKGRFTARQVIPNVFGQTIEICVAVEIQDDAFVVDFAGSSPQCPVAINSTLAFTTSYSLFAIYTILNLQLPISEGVVSCLRVSAPEGSILNATFPAPVFGRTLVGTLVPEMIHRALAPALPDRVMASSGATPVLLQNFFGRFADGRAFTSLNAMSGGTGARDGQDGLSCRFFPVNLTNIPAELLEAEMPVVVERRALATNSAGAGKYRGGFGGELAFRVLDGELGPRDGVDLRVRGGRGHPVSGLFGGQDARQFRIVLNGEEMPKEWPGATLQPGDRVALFTPGGGGFGDPAERDPQAIADDVANGLIIALPAVVV